MVFHHTSGNVKMLRNMLLEFEATEDVSPFEYMQNYISQCPINTEDNKLAWITESFLSIKKHWEFLTEISNHMSEELKGEERDYFLIIFHAVTFQVLPKDMDSLYKTLFNLDKTLLSTFTDFLSNNEVLAYISEVAQAYYDTNYITEKIISPLFSWQPYISEMAHNYAQYIKKIENRKIKPLTVPLQLNVLNRKGKEVITKAVDPLPEIGSPTNSIPNKSKRMLTKTVIDRRLRNLHDKNKQKANDLLNTVKTADYHFAQVKQNKDNQVMSQNRDDNERQHVFKARKPVLKTTLPPIRENAATIKRYNKRRQLAEQEEVEWLQKLLGSYGNTVKIEQIELCDRQEKEKARIYDIERKHIMGQLSYEEAVLAKKRLLDQNKKKYEQFLLEKKTWEDQIEQWRKEQMERTRLIIEGSSLTDLHVSELKYQIIEKNKEKAATQKKLAKELIMEAMRVKQEDLDRKIKMIKEIRLLALIAKKARAPRIIDLTESSGAGLLCEMSIAELQERIAAMKIGIQGEIERKRAQIRNELEASKKEFEGLKHTIQSYMNERETLRKINKPHKKPSVTLDESSVQDLNNLRKILEDKRKKRMTLKAQ